MGRLTQGHGFRIERERIADNREFYEGLREHPTEAAQIGVTRAKIDEQLRVYDAFPPGIERSREVLTTIKVYELDDVTWHKAENQATPRGTLRLVAEIDVNALVRKHLAPRAEEIVARGITMDLGDGTEIRGDIVRTSDHPGPKDARVIDLPYLTITYDASRFASHGEFMYRFDLKTEALSAQKPATFEILRRVTMGEVPVDETTTRLTPTFKLKKPNGHIDAHLGFMKKEEHSFLL